jgi:tetratricopeptide (TPR) repeat protein
LADDADAVDIRPELAEINTRFLANQLTGADGEAIVSALNRVVFDELELRATHDVESPGHLFLGSVLEGKRGYCLGLAALYLGLAEINDIPLYAVATPAHVFLRYDDGVARINIETFQRGANLTDENYAREHSIPERSIRKGIFLRNLTADEFLAQFHNNIGVIYSKRQQYELAEAEYRRALKLHPKFPAAFYNLGNDLLQRREYRQAVKFYNRALRLYPTDVWALNNRGLSYEKRGKLRKARRDFNEALQIQPGFSPAAANLARLSTGEESP